MEWSNKLPAEPGWYFLKVAKAGKPLRIVYVSKVPAGRIGAGELVYAANPGAATVFLRDLPASLPSPRVVGRTNSRAARGGGWPMITSHLPPSVDAGPAFEADFRSEADRWFVVAHDLARIIATHLLTDCDRCPLQASGCDATVGSCEANVLRMYAAGDLRNVINRQW